MVDMLDLGSKAVRRVGSSPILGIHYIKVKAFYLKLISFYKIL